MESYDIEKLSFLYFEYEIIRKLIRKVCRIFSKL